MPKTPQIDDIAAQVAKGVTLKPELALAKTPRDQLLNTGSTLLNLAITNRPNGGFAKGKYFFVVGDSTSGKTFFAFTCLAEANINSNFDDYDFIYDGNEDGALMDFEKFFGKGVEERLRSPAKDKATGEPTCSKTIEQFYFNLDKALDRARHPDPKKRRKFIYILDSENGLTSNQELAKFEEMQEAEKAGTDTTGIMTDGKAKIHSSSMRRVIPELKETECILIVISQTRKNLGNGFAEKTRSGGEALRFYAAVEIWTSVKERLKKRVRSKEREVGIIAEVRLKKNRFTGKNRTIFIPIYHSFGFDDVGANVDYLIDEGELPKVQAPKLPPGTKPAKGAEKKAATYEADVLGITGTRDEIVQHVLDNNLEQDLADIVSETWRAIESETAVVRKSKYA